jgi:hypothetical protein
MALKLKIRVHYKNNIFLLKITTLIYPHKLYALKAGGNHLLSHFPQGRIHPCSISGQVPASIWPVDPGVIEHFRTNFS